MKYVIIGNGAAGIDAAVNIRKNDESGDIKIITSSKYDFYFRPKLIEYVSEDMPVDKLTIYKEDFYKKQNIEVIKNSTVEKIDVDNKKIVTNKSVEYDYDKLLLATGASCFLPPIKGFDKAGVFTVRSIDDCDEIKQFIENKKNLVVIGGGLLGLELAYSMKKAVDNVTVIETNEYLLHRQLDEKGSIFLKKILVDKGLNFYLNSMTKEITGEESVEGVILDDDSVINADAVIISAGVRSNIKLAEQSGLETNRAILVDKNMQTNIKDIYAAGDCAEYDGNVYGLWLTAKEQGKYAGENMAGVKSEYNGSVPSTQLKITGVDVFSSGDYSNNLFDEEVCENDDCYKKIVHDKGDAKGAIVIGDKKAIMVARKVLSGKGQIEEFTNLF